jgi:hypothetical protein
VRSIARHYGLSKSVVQSHKPHLDNDPAAQELSTVLNQKRKDYEVAARVDETGRHLQWEYDEAVPPEQWSQWGIFADVFGDYPNHAFKAADPAGNREGA